MICSHCDKPTSDIGKKCVHCGGEVQESVKRSHGIPLVCPLCGIKTDIILLAGIDLDYCNNCSGIWFDKGEVTKLQDAVLNKSLCGEMASELKALPALIHESDRKNYLDCPVCCLPMSHKTYVEVSGIVLDRCASHGTWIEKEDLARILDILDSGKLEELRSRAKMLKEHKLMERLSRIEADQTRMKIDIQGTKRFQKLHLLLDFLGFT